MRRGHSEPASLLKFLIADLGAMAKLKEDYVPHLWRWRHNTEIPEDEKRDLIKLLIRYKEQPKMRAKALR
jgi:hypothetical protein